MKQRIFLGLVLIAVSACQPTEPIVEHSSSNSIAIRYSAYDIVPTLTAEAIDIAVSHCKKFGQFANYRGANAVNALSTEEIHVFACEARKTDDIAVITAQNERITSLYNASVPTVTTCNTYGTHTSCTSF